MARRRREPEGRAPVGRAPVGRYRDDDVDDPAWYDRPTRGQPLAKPVPSRVPPELAEDYVAAGPGITVRRDGVDHCVLNGGSHQCGFIVVEKGLTIPRQCKRKTALVGVDMSFYRCAHPNGKTSQLIDQAHASGQLPNVTGRQYFCYLHLSYLFGVVPRKTDGKGYGLRAVTRIPPWTPVACFAMMPIRAADVDPERYQRHVVQWTNDPANPINRPAVRDIAEPRVPPPGPAGDYRSYFFDSTCYRDLGDFANDGRLLLAGKARQETYPRLCAGNQELLRAPRGEAAPQEELPIDPGLTRAERTQLLTTGMDPRGDLEDFRPPVPLPRGMAGGLRNIYCWQPERSDSVNCGVRRVRFQMFPPTWPRPAGGVDPAWVDAQGGEWLERIALYTMVPVPATHTKNGGIDLEYEHTNLFWSHQFCPTAANSTRECPPVYRP